MGRRRGKSRAYFLRLEKRNLSNKLITQLEVDRKPSKNNKTSLMKNKKFFEKLYLEGEVENDIFTKNVAYLQKIIRFQKSVILKEDYVTQIYWKLKY